MIRAVHRRALRRYGIVAAWCAALGATVAGARMAPDQAPIPQQPPFRSGADVVEVDVIVADNTGRPLAGLVAGDFTLLVDGKPRAIASAELVTYDTAAGAAGAGDLPARALEEASFSSNASARPGRLFVLVADQGNMTKGGGKGAMEAAARFVDGLSPADRIAFVTLPVGPAIDFTADRALVKATAAKVIGGGANRYEGSYFKGVSLGESFAFVTGTQRRLFEEAVAQECRQTRSQSEFNLCRAELEADARNKVMTAHAAQQATVQSLRALFDRLTVIDGPKYVVFIGQALVTGSSFGDLSGAADFEWVSAKAQAAR